MLKPYTEMKDSDVEWLGEVPAHWYVAPVKRYYRVQLGKMLQFRPRTPDDCQVRYLKAKNVQWFDVRMTDADKMYASINELDRYGVDVGDLLVCEGGEGGRCAIVAYMEAHTGPCIIQNALHRVRPHVSKSGAYISRNDYLQYVLSTVSSTGWFDALNDKATIAHFTADKFGVLAVPIPPLSEQTAIARFLDHADRNIQRYIQSREQLIALLGELKQSVIQAAVTGRIDVRTGQPYPKMKDSGLERVGNVPSHWDVRKLSSLFRRVGSGTTPSNEHYYGGGIPWVMSGDLNDATLRRTARTVTAEAVRESAALRVYPAGSLVIAMYGATIGVTGIMSVAACTNQACFVLTDPVCGTEPLFVQTAMASSRLELVRRSFGGSQPNISAEILRAFRIVVPPPSEQAAIATHLDKVTTGIESAIQCAKRQIQLFREYRARLIADVVTGKLDVREAVAARLPDTDPIDAKANGRSSACESTGAECDEMLVVAENEDG